MYCLFRLGYVLLLAVVCTLLISACSSKKSRIGNSEADLLHRNQKQLTEVMIYDVFSPPVASRIYSYTSLAAYEAIRFEENGYPSITAQLQGFPEMPKPDPETKYDFSLAAMKAFFTVSHKVVFSIDSLKRYEENIYNEFKQSLDEEIYNRSIAFGEVVGVRILERGRK